MFLKKIFTPWYGLPLVIALALAVFALSTVWISKSDAFIEVKRAMRDCGELSTLIDAGGDIRLAPFGNSFSLRGDSGEMQLTAYGNKGEQRVTLKFSLHKKVGIWSIEAASVNGKKIVLSNERRISCGFTKES